MKEPTESEIVNARWAVYERVKGKGIERVPLAMEHWEGACWHKDEIYFGILIGLQIAEGRKKQSRKAADDAERAAR